MKWLARKSAQQDRRNRRHWDHLREEPVAPGAVTWAVLGDSAAVGLGASAVEHSYVARTAHRITQERGRTVSVINLARSGATADTVLARQVPKLAALGRVDIVTCVVGGNDVAWTRRFDAAAFATAIEAIADQLPQGATLGLVPTFGHWPYDGRVALANSAIRSAAANRGLTVADLSTASGATWSQRFRLLSRDFFHPNDTGHQRWSELLLPQVLGQLGPAS